jgi:hypothetical protein
MEANAAGLAFARSLEAAVGAYSVARASEPYAVERFLPPETG